MFVKTTSSGGRQYVELVEAFRDDAGAPRQRVIATLGRIEAGYESLAGRHLGTGRAD